MRGAGVRAGEGASAARGLGGEPGSGAARHVAIIMDGNGRWARQRGLPRTFGHRAGVQALKRTVEAAPDLGVEWLTVFGFSLVGASIETFADPAKMRRLVRDVSRGAAPAKAQRA